MTGEFKEYERRHPWYVELNSETANAIFQDCSNVCASPDLKIEDFSNDMVKYYLDNLQTMDEFKAKLALRDMILGVIQHTDDKRYGWPRSAVAITGSSVTGLASRNSDVDLCILIYDCLEHFRNEAEAVRACLEIIEFRLREDEGFNKVLLREANNNDVRIKLIDASIPLLKLSVKVQGCTLDCDLTVVCNKKGYIASLHNSFLLRHYVRLDERVGPLCFFIKQWAKNYKIHGPQNGHLNSYCLTLLVIHYLQCGLSPPILPNLTQLYPSFFAISENDFPHRLDFKAPLPWELDAKVENPLDVGQLFYGFLAYYAEFDFKKLQINMKEGRVVLRNRMLYPERATRFLDICDPIDSHNPARTLGREGMNYMKTIFHGLRQLCQDSVKEKQKLSFEQLLGLNFLDDS